MSKSESLLLKRYDNGGKGFTQSDANFLLNKIESFYKKALNIGVPLPHSNYLKIRQEKNGLCYLEEEVEYIGTDLRKYIRQESKLTIKSEQFVKEYLRIIRRVWENSFCIGLDTSPANFAISPTGTLFYLDVMPPRQKTDEGNIFQNYPAEPEEYATLLNKRYFSTDQLVYVCTSLLKDIRMSGIRYGLPTVIRLLSEILEPNAPLLLDRVVLQTKERIRNSTLSFENIDDLRFLSSYLYEQKIIESDLVDNILANTFVNQQGYLDDASSLYTATQLIKSYI